MGSGDESGIGASCGEEDEEDADSWEECGEDEGASEGDGGVAGGESEIVAVDESGEWEAEVVAVGLDDRVGHWALAGEDQFEELGCGAGEERGEDRGESADGVAVVEEEGEGDDGPCAYESEVAEEGVPVFGLEGTVDAVCDRVDGGECVEEDEVEEGDEDERDDERGGELVEGDPALAELLGGAVGHGLGVLSRRRGGVHEVKSVKLYPI